MVVKGIARVRHSSYTPNVSARPSRGQLLLVFPKNLANPTP